jgi:hypothetical protein
LPLLILSFVIASLLALRRTFRYASGLKGKHSSAKTKIDKFAQSYAMT